MLIDVANVSFLEFLTKYIKNQTIKNIFLDVKTLQPAINTSSNNHKTPHKFHASKTHKMKGKWLLLYNLGSIF